MIYFLITTCLHDKFFTNNTELRKNHYIAAINRVKEVIVDIDNIKVIIIENNGKRETFLDNFGIEIYYTNNNNINTRNKGLIELTDIHSCINHYDIRDSDFVVKLTGRYLLHNDSIFINELKKVNNNNNIHCIIKYGWWEEPVNKRNKSCITGVIGMLCKYVKQIKPVSQCIEFDWANVSNTISDDNLIMLDKIGIDVYPGNKKYIL
jgi:hypothetical protein